MLCFITKLEPRGLMFYCGQASKVVVTFSAACFLAADCCVARFLVEGCALRAALGRPGLPQTLRRRLAAQMAEPPENSLYTVLVHLQNGHISMTPTPPGAPVGNPGDKVYLYWRVIATDMEESEARAYVRTYWKDMTPRDVAYTMWREGGHSKYEGLSEEQFEDLYRRPSVNEFREETFADQRLARRNREAANAWADVLGGGFSLDDDDDVDCEEEGDAERWGQICLGFDQKPPSPQRDSADEENEPNGEASGAVAAQPVRKRGQKSVKRPRGVRRAEARLRAKQGHNVDVIKDCASGGVQAGCFEAPRPYAQKPINPNAPAFVPRAQATTFVPSVNSPVFVPRVDSPVFVPQMTLQLSQ